MSSYNIKFSILSKVGEYAIREYFFVPFTPFGSHILIHVGEGDPSA